MSRKISVGIDHSRIGHRYITESIRMIASLFASKKQAVMQDSKVLNSYVAFKHRICTADDNCSRAI